MVTVLRVEKHGVGPYYNYDFDPREEPHRPSPFVDGIPQRRVNVMTRFGFKSPWQLRQWFKADDRELLEELGYDIVVYEMPDNTGAIVYGRRQVAFDRFQARVVHREPISRSLPNKIYPTN